MSTEKIVLVASVYDQADILSDYIEWHLQLGIDLIVVQDCGSTDGSQDVLNRLAATGQVKWLVLPERNMLKYASDVVLATMARDEYAAEWIIQCDADEFLSPQGDDLRTILDNAKNNDFTALSVPVLSMTGLPLQPRRSALQTLTLRVDRPVQEGQQAVLGELPVPYIFMWHPPKTIIRAAAFVEYGPGTHLAKTAWGQSGRLPHLQFLHYPIRGFDKLQTKVRNTAAWLRDNPHLQSWAEWGWHWRRWIRLNQEGRLREDYESQFVSPARAEELIRDGICSIDETVSNWIGTREEPLC